MPTISLASAFNLQYQEQKFDLANSSGVISFTEDQRLAIGLDVYFSVFFASPKGYQNFKYPRTKGFYGYAQLMHGAFVAETIPIEYINQKIVSYDSVISRLESTIIAIPFWFFNFPSLGPIDISSGMVPQRNRITSIRYKLPEGVRIACIINWMNLRTGQNGTIIPNTTPQGNAPIPENDGTQTPQPLPQTSDPFDPTDNDDSKTTDPNKKPPTVDGDGCWWMTGDYTYPNCEVYTRNAALIQATDPNDSPYLDAGTPNPCPGSRNYNVIYKGQVIDTPGGLRSNTFYYASKPIPAPQ